MFWEMCRSNRWCNIGKQWHEPKAAFRPKAGNGTYEKREKERVAMAAVKAKEKEMKEEKEAERQVGLGFLFRMWVWDCRLMIEIAEENDGAEGEESCEGGEGAICEVGRDDASETGGAVEEEGEEE